MTDFKKNETNSSFLQNNVSAFDDQFENLEWNFKEDLILAPVPRDNRKDYIIASASGEFEPFYLSEIWQNFKTLDKARWSPKEKNVFYFLAKENGEEKSNLYSINLDEKIPRPCSCRKWLLMIFLKNQSIIWKRTIFFSKAIWMAAVRRKSTATNSSTSPSVKKPDLIVYDEDRQALVSEERIFSFITTGCKIFSKKSEAAFWVSQFSDDGKKLLFWSNNEISVMFLRKWEVQPYRDENEIQTIIRLSSPLKNVFWYRDYEHVFFSAKNKIKLIELDPRDRRICPDIFENNLDEFPATMTLETGIIIS